MKKILLYGTKKVMFRGLRVIAKQYRDYHIIILGDYNLRNLKWNCDNLNVKN